MEKKIIKRSGYTGDVHLRESADGAPSRTIEGYAILFNNESAPLWEDEREVVREIIAPEAVTRDLLDSSDIKFTMFHDRQLILARSKNGQGTLTYDIDDKGVSFRFDAPHTVDGDKALELVRLGNLSGCSFAFSTAYWDTQCVERQSETVNGVIQTRYIVRHIDGIYDMTLAADPAYPDTSVEAREFVEQLRSKPEDEPEDSDEEDVEEPDEGPADETEDEEKDKEKKEAERREYFRRASERQCL